MIFLALTLIACSIFGAGMALGFAWGRNVGRDEAFEYVDSWHEQRERSAW